MAIHYAIDESDGARATLEELDAGCAAFCKLLLATSAHCLDAKVDGRGKTPLILAINKMMVRTVEELLRAKADPNEKDSKGNTALHHAARKHLRKTERCDYTVYRATILFTYVQRWTQQNFDYTVFLCPALDTAKQYNRTCAKLGSANMGLAALYLFVSVGRLDDQCRMTAFASPCCQVSRARQDDRAVGVLACQHQRTESARRKSASYRRQPERKNWRAGRHGVRQMSFNATFKS
eukprot:SAG31_NODE_5397_length_2560_cov_7.077204_3_plen_236_part_00